MRKPIPGYETLYAVDEDGNVWRIGAPRARPLRPALVGGYQQVTLSQGNVKKAFLVHQLVLLAFEGPCPDGEQTRHLNGIKADNRRSNLKWGTIAENAADRVVHGTTPRGERHARAILTEDQVREIRAGTSGIRNLNKRYGVSKSTIDAVRTRRIWRHVN